MKVYLYGMKHQARDYSNYPDKGYLRDLFLEEMTYDMRDDFYNVLAYEQELDQEIVEKYRLEFIAEKVIDA